MTNEGNSFKEQKLIYLI